jgi:hypothetical protein
MKLEKLYYRLKSLVADNVEIHIRDNMSHAEVALVFSGNSYHWTHFRADTIENALRRAIDKLRHPEKNYVDEDGNVWKADESSVYSANHIRTFLRNKEGEK